MKRDLDVVRLTDDLKLLKALLDVCLNSTDTNVPMSFYVKRIDAYHIKIRKLIELSDNHFNIKIDA